MFSWEALAAAKEARANLSERLYQLRDSKRTALPATLKKLFTAAINDDLNVPKALGFLWEIMKSKRPDGVKVAAAQEFEKILAIDPFVKRENVPAGVHDLAQQREEARKQKDWKTSDSLRDRLDTMGWLVQDTDKGSELKKKP